jgi:hypothetical protein
MGSGWAPLTTPHFQRCGVEPFLLGCFTPIGNKHPPPLRVDPTDAKPRVKPGVYPHICYIKGGGGCEPRVEPGVWRPEMWAPRVDII